jgi:hypothetical protein
MTDDNWASIWSAFLFNITGVMDFQAEWRGGEVGGWMSGRVDEWGFVSLWGFNQCR